MVNIILASKSKIRAKILNNNGINCTVIPSNVDENIIKETLTKKRISPEIVSKNLAELKARKVSQTNPGKIVIGADSLIDLNGKIISKPRDRKEAIKILKNLNNKTHYLISSVAVFKDSNMIWNLTDKAKLTMKNFSDQELEEYLKKISDDDLYAYNVYQIEGLGKSLFFKIEGDHETIMGLPVKKIKDYFKTLDILK